MWWKNDVVKKTVHGKLVTKVNAIDTVGFVLKSQYNTYKSGLEKKINNAGKKYLILVDLLNITDYNPKITEVEGKILSITGLTTTAALDVDENNTPNVSNLIKKKTDYDTRISNTDTKYLIPTDLHVKYLIQR